MRCHQLVGLDFGAALATVVGVLVEVPVMLSVLRIVPSTREWYAKVAKFASVGWRSPSQPGEPDWFNHRRLIELIGNISPAVAEAPC